MSENKIVPLVRKVGSEDLTDYAEEFEIELIAAINKAYDNGVQPMAIISLLAIHLQMETNSIIRNLE